LVAGDSQVRIPPNVKPSTPIKRSAPTPTTSEPTAQQQ